MKTIWKFPIEWSVSNVSIPEGAQILDVQVQNEQIMMWALVEDQNFLESRVFKVYGTGHAVDDPNIKYLATVQHHSFVWHIFEILKEQTALRVDALSEEAKKLLESQWDHPHWQKSVKRS